MVTHVDLIEAVTAGNPNLAYSKALEREGMFWSEAGACWVAARPEDVDAVLASAASLVRPPGERVPPTLEGSSLGLVFSHFVRMADGERHGALRRAVEHALATIDLGSVAATSRRLARKMLKESDLDRFLTALPVSTLASLCGVADEALETVADHTSSVVRAMAPGASADDVATGCRAADESIRIFSAVLGDAEAPAVVTELRRLLIEDGQHEPVVAVANLIGFLIQSHDATAGLIGDTLVYLARNPDLPRTRAAIADAVRHVARHDPSVHNTRRYVSEPMRAGTAEVARGDTILVALAAANVADPNRSWSFGAGRHACPGREIAMTIAVEGVTAVCEAGLVPERLPDPIPYRPLGNVRIPVFGQLPGEGVTA